MLTLTQLRQLTGVSRRTLQDYDDMGLLKHRGTTPGGYWIYADEDVERLRLIQLLRQIGYSRKEIGALIDSPDISLSRLLDSAQASLEKKRDRLDLTLQHIGAIRFRQHLSCIAPGAANQPAAQESAAPCGPDRMPDAAGVAELAPGDAVHPYAPILLHIVSIAQLQDQPVDSPVVQQRVESILHARPHPEEATSAAFFDRLCAVADSPDFDRLTAPGAGAFVISAVQHYQKTHGRKAP